MTLPQRKIIHVDMDCFYAAVEIRDNPKLIDLPVAVGSPPDTRGVLCTANYVARKYGVNSGMASGIAYRKCPDLIFIKPNFKKYSKISNQIREIFSEYTDLIEPLSLDEAFLDVTGLTKCSGSATLMAKEIQNKILKKTGLTASAGIAPNKFLAKVGSDWNKPNGIFTICPEDVVSFSAKLPVGKIPGVGKVTKAKLNKLGIFNCSDIKDYNLDFLYKHFGGMGETLYERSFGIDNRLVINEHIRKSLSVEQTYSTDLPIFCELSKKIGDLKQELCKRLHSFKKNKLPDSIPHKLFVKTKTFDFQTHTVETTFSESDKFELWKTFQFNNSLDKITHELFETAFNRGEKAIRLLGIGVRLQKPQMGPIQLTLF